MTIRSLQSTARHSREDYDILGPMVSSCLHNTPTCVALIVIQSASLCANTNHTNYGKRLVCDGMSYASQMTIRSLQVHETL